MRLLPALLLLAGCSDPFKPLESGGAYWLLDASDDVFQFDERSPKLSADPEGAGLRSGRASWVGEQMVHLVLRRVQGGQEGPLRETERFPVPAGREVRLAVGGVFELRFTATATGDDEKTVDYRVAWEGKAPVQDRIRMPRTGSTMAFLLPKTGARWTLLLVCIESLDP